MIKKHNRKYYFFICICAVLIIVVSVIVYILAPRGKPVIVQENKFPFETVEDGDIICRLGDRFWSKIFRDISVTDKRFSHMGIVRIRNDVITVIHAEGDTGHGRDFVNEIAFDDFVKIARAIGIYRINDIDGSQVSNLAMEYIGIPFDWQFDMEDNTKLYCTELLYVILKRIDPAFELGTTFCKELGKDIITLDSISNSGNFTEMCFFSSGKRR